MEEHLHSFERILKGREFGELHGVVKTAISCIFKFCKATHEKINQHYDLYYEIVAKTQEQNIAIEKQMSKLLNRPDHFDEESILDARSFLKKQNGLDKIMIEEVKTLAEAIIDRRLQEADQQLLTKHDFSIDLKLIDQQLDSLKQEVNLINQQKVNSEQIQSIMKDYKLQMYEQMSRNSGYIGLGQLSARESSKILKVETDIQNIRHCIRSTNKNQNYRIYDDLKLSLEKKIDRKQFSDLKTKLTKQITSKTTPQEVETIMSQFQTKIFQRVNSLSENNKKIQENIQNLKNQFNSHIEDKVAKQKRIKQMTRVVEKLQKKIRSEIVMIKELKQKDFNSLLENQQTLKQYVQKLQFVFNQQMQQMKSAMDLVSEYMIPPRDQTFNLSTFQKSPASVKLSSSSVNSKNKLVPWEQQQFNCNRQNFLWERNKTSVCVVLPGMYHIEVAVHSQRKVEGELTVNGLTKLTLESKEEWKLQQGVVIYLIGVISLCQKSKLSVCLNEQGRVDASIILTRLV